jgi:hypothetical protein
MDLVDGPHGFRPDGPRPSLYPIGSFHATGLGHAEGKGLLPMKCWVESALIYSYLRFSVHAICLIHNPTTPPPSHDQFSECVGRSGSTLSSCQCCGEHLATVTASRRQATAWFMEGTPKAGRSPRSRPAAASATTDTDNDRGNSELFGPWV